MNDLISREAALGGFNVRKVVEYDESGCSVEYMAVPVEKIEKLPVVEAVHNFDLDANIVFDYAMDSRKLRFRETDEMCPICQRDLEVYYCENRTYAVRCPYCKTVALVQAMNAEKAAEKIGLHVKLVYLGRWERYPGPGYIRCTNCKSEFDEDKMPVVRNYCPNCGAEMDGET